MTEQSSVSTDSRRSLWQNLLRLPYRDDPRFGVVFLMLLSVPLIFVSALFEGYETVKFPLFLVLAGVGWLLLAKRDRTIYVDRVLLYSSLALVLWFGVATIFAIDPVNSLVGLYTRYTSSLVFMVGWVLSLILISSVIQGEENRGYTLLRVVVFAGVLNAVLVIFQYFDFAYYGGVNPAPRPIIPGFIGNQNFVAMFLLVVIPAIVVLWPRAISVRRKAIYIASGVLSIWGIVLSGSRGALMGLGVQLAVLLILIVWRRFSKAHLWLTLGTGVIAVLLFMGFFALTRSGNLSGSLNSSDLTIQTRFLVWSDSMDMVKRLPLVGSGPGNFFIAFKQVGNTALSGNERFDDAHNIFFNVVTAVGIPGLLIFLAILGYVFYRAWYGVKAGSDLALFSMVGLLGFLAAAQFNPVSIPCWILFGVFLAFGTISSSHSLQIHRLAHAVGVVVAIGLVVFSVLFLSSEIFSNLGTKAYRNNKLNETRQCMRIASKLNPTNTTARAYLLASQIKLKEDPAAIVPGIEKFIALHPHSSGTYKSAADLYYMLYRSTNDANYRTLMSTNLETAAMREPDFGNLYGTIAYSYFKAGLNDRAEYFLHRELSLPDSDQYIYSWILLSKIYAEKGLKDQAIFAMTTAFRNQPETYVIKGLLQQMKEAPDITQVKFPIVFPEVDLE